jgi:hypothetical protein
MPKLLTHDEFVKRCNDRHNNKYTYPEKYINSATKITILCKLHGPFKQLPFSHLDGRRGCNGCSGQRKYNIDDYVKLAKESNLQFIDIAIPQTTKDKSNWLCINNHKWNTTYHSIQGCATCLECSKIKKHNNMRKTLSEFIDIATKIHGLHTYDYSKVKYVSSGTHVIIICRVDNHGEFIQSPSSHINKMSGCPKCGGCKSENICDELLSDLTGEHFMKVRPEFLNKLELDGFNDKLKLAYEYQGKQHYEVVPYFHRNGEHDLIKQQTNDKIKKQLCKDNNIDLIEIPYKYNYKRPVEMKVFIMIEIEKLGYFWENGKYNKPIVKL